MKTKNEIVALLEIAIVLCSVLLVAIPTIAAEQTTIASASEDEYVLGIYGNANEDDTIDMRDLTYVKLIFFGKKPETELADAKYDGKINPLDFIQIKLVIVGKEKELTFKDAIGKAVTVHKPVTRVVTLPPSSLDAIRAIGARDKVVGVSTYLDKVYFPELSKLPSVGSSWFTPDYEAILGLNPDIVITLTRSGYPEVEDKLGPAGITVIRLEFNKPNLLVDDIRKLGYILDKKDEANEFADWYEGTIDKIKSRTQGLSEDEKPRVYVGYIHQGTDKVSGKGEMITLAGGINIAGDDLESFTPDPEWVIDENPDIICLGVTRFEVPSQGYTADDPTQMKMLREKVMSRPGWERVTAVKSGRVYLTAWQIRLGPSTIVLAAYMAKWFHPELFEDLDPEAIHQEFLDRQRFDYDLDEHGVFVYPPLEE
jgi:iron complex transport system substrate-binding protein